MTGADHFDAVADTYADARPTYPRALLDHLTRTGTIAPGTRVLEIGAGTGQATTDLVAAGCVVTAVEPGPRLARTLRDRVPTATVVPARIEDADLAPAAADTVVAATSMHWVDLPTALPRLHDALAPGGRLAVWRTVYGDPRVPTPFRDAVARIVAHRPRTHTTGDPLDPEPTVARLTTGGWFTHAHTWTHPWHTDLTPDRLQRLFRTFSDWTDDELTALADATNALGPTIREHYVTRLHVLRRT